MTVADFNIVYTWYFKTLNVNSLFTNWYWTNLHIQLEKKNKIIVFFHLLYQMPSGWLDHNLWEAPGISFQEGHQDGGQYSCASMTPDLCQQPNNHMEFPNLVRNCKCVEGDWVVFFGLK